MDKLGKLKGTRFLGIAGLQQLFPDVPRHMIEDVQTHHICGAKAGATGTPYHRASQIVHGLDVIAVLEHELEGLYALIYADAVADEVGCVLGHHHALAQHPLAKLLHKSHAVRAGLLAGDQFQ